jgi:hypothetical protein
MIAASLGALIAQGLFHFGEIPARFILPGSSIAPQSSVSRLKEGGNGTLVIYVEPSPRERQSIHRLLI